MKSFVRSLLAVAAGFVGGSLVNMAIVVLGLRLIPSALGAPGGSGADGAPPLEAPQLIFPFFAHAFGTLAGATLASLIPGAARPMVAYLVGGCFLAGGIAAAFMIPAPAWFIAVDLVLAYLPMAWLGARLGRRWTGGTA